MADPQKPSTGDTVTVACRHPQGLILALPSGERVVLNGYHAKGSNFQGVVGLTSGVSADFWNKWKTLNAESDIIKKQVVFAQSTPTRTESQAKEMASEKTGFEKMPQETPEVKKADAK